MCSSDARRLKSFRHPPSDSGHLSRQRCFNLRTPLYIGLFCPLIYRALALGRGLKLQVPDEGFVALVICRGRGTRLLCLVRGSTYELYLLGDSMRLTCLLRGQKALLIGG